MPSEAAPVLSEVIGPDDSVWRETMLSEVALVPTEGIVGPFQKNCEASISMEHFLQLMLKFVTVQLEGSEINNSIMEHPGQLDDSSIHMEM